MSQSNQRQKLSVKRIERLRTRCIPYKPEELTVIKARAEAKREGWPERHWPVFNDPRQGDEKPGRHLDETRATTSPATLRRRHWLTC